MTTANGVAKRLALEILGWTVLVLGVLALVLPGPGLLLTFAGLAVLSTQYPWARRLVAPVRVKAWRAAAEGVETVPRMVLSALGALLIAAVGALWLWSPPAPQWWPLRQEWWLLGGPAVGVTLVLSSGIALALLGYAAHRFRGKPHAVAQIDRMEEHHRARVAVRKEARHRLQRMRNHPGA